MLVDATGVPWIVRRDKSNLHRNFSDVPMCFTNITEAQYDKAAVKTCAQPIIAKARSGAGRAQVLGIVAGNEMICSDSAKWGHLRRAEFCCIGTSRAEPASRGR